MPWDGEEATRAADPQQLITALEAQMAAMSDRLESVHAVARDLIAPADLDAVLARITERAATAVRAPRYLLAVRAWWLVMRWVSIASRSSRRPRPRSCSHTGLLHSNRCSAPQTSLTSTSSRPWSPSMRSARRATCAGSRWSTATAMPSPPAALTSSAVSSIVSGLSTSERRWRVLRPVT